MGGVRDCFVSKLDRFGNILLSIHLGGGGFDEGTGIAVDDTGAVYVTGFTDSAGITFLDPMGMESTGTIQPGLAGGSDGFVAKLRSDLTLSYFTYLGGSQCDKATAIDIDSTGSVVLTGYTNSSDFPTYEPTQDPRGFKGSACDCSEGDSIDPCYDAFVTRLDNTA